ncbi:hypothetical protein Agub_g3650 [Astrephomene gubernaculifera]|nr:hypothetical protein Agub_g3650 [Astrephomene gubernaculifera]
MDRGTPLAPSPATPSLSPRAATVAIARATASNVSPGAAAAAVCGVRTSAALSRLGESAPHSRPCSRPTTTPPGGAAGACTAMRPVVAAATLGVDTIVQGPPLTPDPVVELMRVSAYSGEFVRCLVWIPGTEEVAFAAASMVVLMRVSDTLPQPAANAAADQQPLVEPGRQRHLLGHTSFVCALAVSSDGGLLASAQEGKEATVRLWDVASGVCLTVLSAHASGLSCVDISPDVRAVAAVGLDEHGRQTIALWNISEVRIPHGKVALVTRHATEFNIKVLRFSAYQEDHLLTAGRDSIRIYRLKGGQLRGTSVRLVPREKRTANHVGSVSAAAGPNIFTDIAFEAGVGVYGVDAFKVYVSSASGAVFVVDYTTRSLDAVYQLHSAGINCLLVADGLAITGGDDRLLRAWPLDFRDFLLEAEHEGSVTGLALSPDALRIAIGTENGALGCLHIPNHAYTTLLRSHSGAVNAVAVDPSRDQFCTVSSDGTIRIWHLLTHQQLYEFDAPGEAVTCIAYHPLPSHHELAAGFANGRLRVFDVPTTTLLQEQQQHRGAVAELVFSPDGERLFSGGADGALVTYDVQRLYAPTQYLSAGVRDIRVCVAVSPNGALVASLTRDPYRGVTSLLIFHGRTLAPFMRIETDAPTYIKLAFSADGNELWALTSLRRLDRYELREGQLVQQIRDISNLEVTALAMDPVGRYALTAGNDGLLRVWGCVPLPALQPRGLPPNQAFLGHPGAVLGAAFHRGHLITVGDADCICVWRVTADTPPPHASLDPAVARASVAQRLGALPPALRPMGSPGLDPRDPLSRATPATALGPVANASDHRLTARAAALASPGVPQARLVPASSSPVVRPGTATGLPSQQAQAPIVSPFPAVANAAVAAADAAAAALAAAKLNSPGVYTAPAVIPRPTNYTSASPYSSPIAVRQAPSGPFMPPSAGAPPPLRQEQQPQLPSPQVPRAPEPPPKCSWLLGYTPSGFNNVTWRPETGLFAYSIEEMVVLEHLATREQRYLRAHTRSLGCLAASKDGSLIAAAPRTAEHHVVQPEASLGASSATQPVVCTTAPFADVVVWDVASGKERWRLRYHPHGVQALCFSPDGRWLLSIGREPERSVVVWDVSAGLLVAAGRTESSPAAVEWLWGGDNPSFASVGKDGLLLWTLLDSFLEQRSVPLGDQDDAVPCTALAIDPAGALLVAEAPKCTDGDGPMGQIPLWHIDVANAFADGPATMVQVASLPGDTAVTAMAVGSSHALVATETGNLVRFRRDTHSGVWCEESSVQLDGCVRSLSAEPGMADAVVATTTATIWFVGMQDASCVPIVCGQQGPVLALVAAPHDPRVMASTSGDGMLRVWYLGLGDAEPTVELQSSSACTTATFAMHSLPAPKPASSPQAEPARQPKSGSSPKPPPVPLLLGGYEDGSLRLFSMQPTVELRWALARHPAPVVGVAVHPTKPLVLTASSDGSLAVTDLGSTRLLSYITALTACPAPAPPSRRSPGPPPRSTPPPPPDPPRPGTGPMQALTVSPGTGASLTAVGWRDRFVVFAAPWDDPACTPIAEYDIKSPGSSRRRDADGAAGADGSAQSQSPDVPALLSFLGGGSKLLAFSSPLLLGEVVVYDYRLAAVVRRVTVPQMVRSMAVSHDGRAMLLGGMERSAFLAHMGTGNVHTLEGHAGPVMAVGFSSDGNQAISAAGSTMMVWEAPKLLLKLEAAPPPPPRPTQLQF